MLNDAFSHQLPDIDPGETQEWLDSLEAVVEHRGKARARYLLARLGEAAHAGQLGVAASVWTPYINTIPTDVQPWFPGDFEMERRIRAFIRWNAVAMVIRANRASPGIGGHLATYASSAALYEVGFNHFFRGQADGTPGDHVYIQGHASPGIYARAFLEGRFDEADLDRFRLDIDTPDRSGRGLTSYPHPHMMGDFWQFPTVSMGLGPINSIYQARFDRYLHNRRIDDTSNSRVWAFLGDGEVDEPETLGAINLAAREGLDNLTWVINCNLQRLDGPVRGNNKIIQELEGVFRGNGWNVIKVVWGAAWDELLANDVDGVLLEKMNTTVDGEFQRYATESGAYIREHFFGPDPRLRKLVEHLSDEELQSLPRGGHDYSKVYAAYRSATEMAGAPTVILAKTVKGWALGSKVEGRNSTHQIKKMDTEQLRELRQRLHLESDVSEEAIADGDPPYLRFSEDSPEHRYLMERRRNLDGPLPARSLPVRRGLGAVEGHTWDELLSGSNGQQVSSTMAFTRLLRSLARDQTVGDRVVPIVPDEARTFGMDALFRELEIYAAQGQRYEPVDHHLLLSYVESAQGQILEEGITEAGSMASWTAAATSYATTGVPMLPFFIFYSMFGFQRVGDLIWAAGDARARGFLLGATAGRTTLEGEGLQHTDGHSQLLASTVPNCRAYDPAFAWEMALIIKDGLARMYPASTAGDPAGGEDVFYYLTLYNENYEMPPAPEAEGGIGQLTEWVTRGLYRSHAAPEATHRGSVLYSGTGWSAAVEAQRILAEDYDVGVDLWSATSYNELRREALAVERWNRLHPESPERTPLITELLSEGEGPVLAVSDFLSSWADQVVRWVPRPLTVLGTDGFGRSDDRAHLRRFFETDAAHVVVGVLSAMSRSGTIEASLAMKAIDRFGIDADVDPPWTL